MWVQPLGTIKPFQLPQTTIYDGAVASGYFGAHMATGDINGDSKNDLVIGADSEDNNGTDSGSAYVIFSTLIDDVGSTTGNNKALSTSTNYNSASDFATNEGFLIGDVNGDNSGDLVFGSQRTDYNGVTDGGSAWVIFSTLIDDVGSTTGNNKALSTSTNYNIRYDGINGINLIRDGAMAAGDVNGDGLGDLVLGGSTNGGYAWVIFSTLIDDVGSTTGNNKYLATPTNYNVSFYGEDSVNFKTRLTFDGTIRIGDVNGDGLGDLVLGAPYGWQYGANRGEVYIIFSTLMDDYVGTGNSERLRDGGFNIMYAGENSSAFLALGNSIAIGDVDGDGKTDLMVGSFKGSYLVSNPGYLWIFNSALLDDFGETTNNRIQLSNDSNYFTSRYFGADRNDWLTDDNAIAIGDFNNDSVDDLILAAKGAQDYKGSVYVIYGELPNVAPNLPSSLGGQVDGSYTNDNTPTFTFTLSDNDVGDTVKFQIQIDDNSDFSSLIVDYTSAFGEEGSKSFTVGQQVGSGSYSTGNEGQILLDGNYYWRVKAIDAGGLESSFATANSGSIAFKVDSTAPDVPGIASTTSPTANTTPTWTWTASSDSGSGLAPTPYTVQWCENSDFSGCGLNTDTVLATNYTHSIALSDGIWYFRLKATDVAGNNSNYSPNGSVIVDTTAPTAIDLDSPGSDSYTNNERPVFKWKATTDSGSGLSKYKLSVNNGDMGGSFSIDNIDTSGSGTVEFNRYTIIYENFDDADSTNNYISVYTKSHSDWPSSENNGKLKEGNRSWSVIAYDSAGNTVSVSRQIKIDRTAPRLSSLKVSGNTNKFTISGNLSDTKAGSNASKSDYVRSNPDKVEIEIIKEGVFINQSIATATLNLDSICDYSDTTLDTLNCNFSKEVEADFGTGSFLVKIKGIDKAGNSTNIEESVLVGTPVPEPTPVEDFTPASLSPVITPKEEAEPLKTGEEKPSPAGEISKKVIEFVKNLTFNISEGVVTVSKAIVQTARLVVTTLIKTPQKTVSFVGSFMNRPRLVLDISTERVVNRIGFILAAIFPGTRTKIMNVEVIDVTSTSATIVWETNHPATSKVNFGTSPEFEMGSVYDEEPLRIHRAVLENLPNNTEIYFEVISEGRTTSYDAYRTFKTKK